MPVLAQPPSSVAPTMADPVLHMDVLPDEDDAMATMGYAFEQRPLLSSAHLAVSPRVSSQVAAETVKMLFMFNQLKRLQLRFDFDDITITQPMVCAIAELLQLTSLQLLHGELEPGLDISHWSSLRSLAELKLLPGEEGGLRSQQVDQLTGLSSSLTSLALRPHPEEVTQESPWHLAGMSQLQELSLCPLPEACTPPDLQLLLEMPNLRRLQLGTNDAAQVLMLTDAKVPDSGPQEVSLLVRDACEPGPAADVLTVISWTLPQYLTALSIGPLAAPCPNDILVTLATLTNLQSLQLQLVAPPGQHVSGTVELLSLSPCRKLTCLEVLTSSRLYVPFTLKTVSLATLAWPNLAALRLSLAGRRELMPEALDMCDNFTALKELQLFSPLEDTPVEDLQPNTGPVEVAADTMRSSWAGWAASRLGLGLFAAGAASNGNGATHASTGGVGSTAGRIGDSSLSRGGSGMSPLVQDLHQRDLVQQVHWKQHKAAHHVHVQEQHSLQGASAAHSHHLACSTLQDKQLLPPAVGSFQQHKVMKAGSLFGPVPGSQEGQQGGLDSQGSGSWSPTWLLRSFMPFGSPVSGTLSAAAESPMAQQQQQQGSWMLLDACRGRVSARRAASLEPGQTWLPNQQQHHLPGSRLQHSSSTAGVGPGGASHDPIRRAATISAHGAVELEASLQRRASSPSAVAAPGLDLAMYRASGLLVPLNLNYMPKSLTKLCLQNYHCVAIGMPDTAAQSSISVPPSAGDSNVYNQQQQEENDSASAQQEGVPQSDTAADAGGSAGVEPPGPQAPEQLAQDQQTDAAEGVAAPTRAALTDAGAPAVSTTLEEVKPAACSAGGSLSAMGASSSSEGAPALVRGVLHQLPLPHLLHLELDGCRIDDDTMIALLKSSPGLRALEVAGLEGLTNTGLSQVSSLQHLTRLCVEAEDTTGISLASLAAVRRLHRLKKLHWCSRDSLHSPMDTDLLTAQLSGLTGLRQLVLLVAPDSEAYAMSGWRVVLQRRLPLCRLVLRRELLQLDGWGDVPEEGAV